MKLIKVFSCGMMISGVVLCYSCLKNSKDPSIEFYSHAVTGLSNPQSPFRDNSKEGFEYALSFKGLDGIEVDVQMSVDSSLWLFHDVFLEERTSGQGFICEKDDGYLSSISFDDGSSLSLLNSVELSNVQGEKKIFFDVKYVGMCGNTLVTASRLINEVSEYIEHPLLNVSFIINKPEVAEQVRNMGFKVYQDAFEKSDVDLTSTVFNGWYIRNTLISADEIKEAHSAGKEIFIYEVYSSGSIRKAIRKGPDGMLIEDVKEAIILSE